MKHARRLTALLLCIALLASLAACGGNEQETTQSTTAPPVTTTAPEVTEPSAASLYAQAAAPVREMTDLTLELTVRESMTIGTAELIIISTQKLQYSGTGTEDPRISMTEKITLDDYEDSFAEYYADGTLYTIVYDEYYFKGAMEYEDYVSRFAPAVLLDESLYSTIKTVESADNTVFIFSGADVPESWAMPEGAEFIEGSGSATVNQDGTLARTVYNITYSLCGITYQMQYTAVPGPAPETAPSLTGDPGDYRELNCIDAPRIYDMATMYLCSTCSASSFTTESIVSQASGAVRVQQTGTKFYVDDQDACFDVDIDLTVQDAQENYIYSQTEHFQDGKYTFSADGSTPEENPDVDAAAMYSYCLDYLVDNIFSLTYLRSAEATWIGDIVYLEIDYTDEVGDTLNTYTSEMMFSDGDFLNDLASAYKTKECTGYLAVNALTSFPTALGLSYEGLHTIDGTEYSMVLQLDQSLALADPAVYEEITGEALPEEEPEEKATPLFYHVTGPNGQEMWLLGTIHVGDERTRYLPQEIYDAFAASDALALEYDSAAFEAQLETDTDLQAEVSGCYYYQDGSSASQHLSQEIYDDALILMKASGSYSISADYMKPSLWSSSIDNFFLRQGYSLSSSQGVESRLEKLAAEQNKPIRSVESGLFQIQMLTGFSDAVQEMLLEGSVTGSIRDYCGSVLELYELWCAGDEAALRVALTEDLSDATEEELALYEEYNKAMSIDRNKGMLDVAVGYLESGDVVFYAVGLAHLLDATNGLVEALRSAGYTVELVSYE